MKRWIGSWIKYFVDRWLASGESCEDLLKKHFGSLSLTSIVTTVRVFPSTARVDLQQALDTIFKEQYPLQKFVGVHERYSHDTTSFSSLLSSGGSEATVGPLQYDDVEVGNDLPARCLKNALWMAHSGELPFVVLTSPAMNYGRVSGVHVEVAVPPGEAGLEFSRSFLSQLEKQVNAAGSYRGKILSLEIADNYSGKVSGVKVHRLRSVTRDQVILPEKTLQLLERNISDFIQYREELKALQMPIKKGLLFYGPPGTGKTHTIHYLASQMPDHTTFLINAEQVALMDHYIQLARFLQPAAIVIEDADLIARSRTSMNSPCEESLLNKLLNEMDGLREDAQLLFILTTNRPEQLEPALAARPGRIDQAIEFPLPDDEGRRKLVKLYAGGLTISAELVEVLVRKTRKASAAFIKELMRRSAQYTLQAKNGNMLLPEQVEQALDEMLFSGGSLNRKLLGAGDDSDSPS
ncbi:MAG: hypothetical protein B9S32_12985 [Verrucomicrobia bacterium Tous-C9LFEB]|nr:MAG: hypothetical protein B9S32_12985 [Verrucomicrobia bacterium Tous-C9LFEB]